MAKKRKTKSVSSKAEERALVLKHIEALVAAGLAIRCPGGRRIGLLTGELYAFTEEGVVRLGH
jgi:hypothetical protein